MNDLCMNCMEKITNEETCPNCGAKTDGVQVPPFMPKKTILAKRYIVGQGMEFDGEGLSYIGYDSVKNMKIYIREFYPSNLCRREADFTHVNIRENEQKVFEILLDDFLKYFRSVARLRNLPALKAVYDIFQENGTAYVIFEWVEGTRLDKYLSEKGGSISWEEAKIMFMPLLSSLSHMSSSKIFHLGICPGNMIVTQDKKIKLAGFATKNLRQAGSLIENELYDGCSALEQYLDVYEPDESTDIYGFTASLFLALTGEYPQTATQRKQDDKLLMPQNIIKNLPENVVSALANALRVYPNNRMLSFETLRAELANSPVVQVKNINNEPEDTFDNSEFKNKKSSNFMWGVISCVTALLILIAGLVVYWVWLRDNTKNQNENAISAQNEDETKLEEDEAEFAIPEKIAVPELVGRNYQNLQSELANNDMYKTLLQSEELHDTIGEGCIISQTPNYGEEMYMGTTIIVIVSKGPQKRTLPNIEGKTLSEAAQIISNAKLRPVEIREYNSEVEEGRVIRYKDYKAGDTLDYDSEVVIVVSNGLK